MDYRHLREFVGVVFKFPHLVTEKFVINGEKNRVRVHPLFELRFFHPELRKY
jgi:hypothetical protein